MEPVDERRGILHEETTKKDGGWERKEKDESRKQKRETGLRESVKCFVVRDGHNARGECLGYVKVSWNMMSIATYRSQGFNIVIEHGKKIYQITCD